ncbi:MAG: SpaH/EbpB family LPXTG-anchored major pilin, partial [Lachnospiraceae bacterium]|nr:SpaH/EbpB family LPXTG-anchored major pilin [Lachnospiraceae bacterium]
HKYVQAKDENGDYVPGQAGTGQEITGSVPGGASPLKGVEFTIYKIKDKDYLLNMYSGELAPDDLPKTTEDIKNKYGVISASGYEPTGKWIVTEWQIGSSVYNTAQTATTDENGAASFGNLDLGIYLVVETNSPASVYKAADPFLVAVPMTANGTEWLYDVHVYPKNEVGSSGEISLYKVGKISGTTQTTPLQGVTFALQKYSDTTGKWETITAGVGSDNQEGSGEAFNLTTDADGKIMVDNLALGRYRFVEVDTVGGYILDGDASYEFQVTPAGHSWNWSFTTSNGTGTMWFMPDGKHPEIWTPVSTGDPVVTAPPVIINEQPDLVKEVAPKSDPDNWGKDADYEIGDTVPYRVKVSVPSDIFLRRLEEFVVTDAPVNLKDDLDSIVVKGDAGEYGLWNPDTFEMEYGMVTLPRGADYDGFYTVEPYGENGFKVIFNIPMLSQNDFTGKELTIEYNAVLLDTAVTTTAGNPNTAKLEYTNSLFPNPDWDDGNPNAGKDPGKNTIEDSAVVYTFQIDIEKTDDANKPLSGVVFELYRLVDASVTENVLTAEQAKEKGLEAVAGKVYQKIGEDLVTGTDGTANVKGLTNGDYWLVETKTEEGYNLLKSPVKVTLNVQYATHTTTTTTWTETSDGKTLVKTTIDAALTTFTDGGKNPDNIGNTTQTVINKKGFELPSTGGMGTFIFTFVGIAMMAAAVILFVTSKKKEVK